MSYVDPDGRLCAPENPLFKALVAGNIVG